MKVPVNRALTYSGPRGVALAGNGLEAPSTTGLKRSTTWVSTGSPLKELLFHQQALRPLSSERGPGEPAAADFGAGTPVAAQKRRWDFPGFFAIRMEANSRWGSATTSS